MTYGLWLLCSLCLNPDQSADSKLLIWQEIATVEQTLRTQVNQENQLFVVSSSDPVRGFFVERVGVVLLIPIRYRQPLLAKKSESPQIVPASAEKVPVTMQRLELKKRLEQWRSELDRREVLKDSAFNRLVTNLKSSVPGILKTLSHLAPGANLTLIIEEREPAWYHAGLSLAQNPTRKVVTLTVEPEAIEKITANETVFSRDWLYSIKQTTTRRSLASRALP